ncbi:MAG TPA: sugar transferase [Thermoanaerobaculia bacterium]|nr:sugar transferase [Thermoanaerobaculia bacterium]
MSRRAEPPDAHTPLYSLEPGGFVGPDGSLALDDTGTFVWVPPGLRSWDPVGAFIKRGMDLVLGSLFLLLCSPVLLAAMLAVKLTSPGPALFVQRRIGYRGRKFRMLKLRTMRHGAEHFEEELARRQQRAGRVFLKLADDPRVTPLGRFLRRASIDELPQLWNVLRGDMSLVGPRPLLLTDFRKFPKREQMRRFAMKPGITGLWQVSGRSGVSDAERIRLDLEYVDRWTPGLDVAILARTIPVVLSTKGAS